MVYVISNGTGDPLRSTLTYLVYFFQVAFQRFNMGYASALVWVLFLIIMAFTVLVFKSSSLWVYYEFEMRSAMLAAGTRSERMSANGRLG